MNERRVDFISGNEAARVLGVSPATFKKLASQRPFATLELPGLPPRYRAADVEAYRAARTKPAAQLAVQS